MTRVSYSSEYLCLVVTLLAIIERTLQSDSVAVSVLSPITQVVYRGAEAIFRIQTDTPNELYLLNIEWYPVASPDHSEAAYKPIPVPEIKIRKSPEPGLPATEIYFDSSAVSSALDIPGVTIPLRSASQTYLLTVITQYTDLSYSIRLSSEHLALLPFGTDMTVATHSSSITLHLEDLQPNYKYCLLVEVCEGAFQEGIYLRDQEQSGGEVVRFGVRKGEKGDRSAYLVPFVATAKVQNKVALVSDDRQLTVARLKIICLVDGAKMRDIANRQALYPAEVMPNTGYSLMEVKPIGIKEFELTIEKSSEPVHYTLIAAASEQAITFRAHCLQDQLVFQYASQTEAEKQEYLKKKPSSTVSNQTHILELQSKKVELGVLSQGSYTGSKGYLTKKPDGEPLFLEGVLEEQEFYYLLAGRTNYTMHSQIIGVNGDSWWSPHLWSEEPLYDSYRLQILLAWVVILIITCYMCRRKTDTAHRTYERGSQSELSRLDTTQTKMEIQPRVIVQNNDREETQASDPENEQEI
jgi:hypothetical protein